MKSIRALQSVLPALVLIVRPGELTLLDTAFTEAEGRLTEALARDLEPQLRALHAAVDAMNH